MFAWLTGGRPRRPKLRPVGKSAARLVWVQLGDPAQVRAPGIVEHTWDPDAELDVQVASPLATEPGHAAIPEAEALSGLRPGGDLDRHAALWSGHLDRASERRLDHGDRNGTHEVGSLTPEEGVVENLDDEDQVARRASASAGVSGA
jgi:hypothetical protein